MSDAMTPLFEPPDWLDREDEVLAPYAMRTRQSRGRRHPEPPHPFRTLYQRDRDRIVHSTAFRRLMYKTQVLVTQTNDHHRTRLTHTLEVAQISRTIARQLGLNEDLTEAIALAHDLGHPPFGHAGEAALDECMADHGGFEHNRHGLRIVAGARISLRRLSRPEPVLGSAAKPWPCTASGRTARRSPTSRRGGQPLLEAQVVDAADSLAYDTHDVDDALGVGLIACDDLEEVEFWRQAARAGPRPLPGHRPAAVSADRGPGADRLAGHRSAGAHPRNGCEKRAFGPWRTSGRHASRWSVPVPKVRALKAELEEFLHRRVYRHSGCRAWRPRGGRLLRALFDEFCRAARPVAGALCPASRRRAGAARWSAITWPA